MTGPIDVKLSKGPSQYQLKRVGRLRSVLIWQIGKAR